jgi:hypothetical protein
MIRVAAETFSVVPRVGSLEESMFDDKIRKVYTPIKTTLMFIEDDQTRLEAHPERAFWEIRASKTKGLWFKKRPKTLFPDASLGIIMSHFMCEFYFLSNLYRKHLATSLGIPKENTFFFSSHNHTDALLTEAPRVYGARKYDACCSEDTLTPEGKDLLKALVKSAQRLPGKVVPARVAWGVGHERRITYNRKGRRADGTTYLMREEDRLLMGKDFNGDIDDIVFVVAFIGANGKPVSYLAEFTGHPATAYHPEIPIVHGDFPQVACDELSKAYGGVPVGFPQGCAGEMNSKGLVSLEPIDLKAARADLYGHYLGRTFIQAAKHLRYSTRDDITFSRERVSLPFKKIPSERSLRRQIAKVNDFLQRCEQADQNALTCLGLNVARNMSPKYRGGLLMPHKRWAEWALKFHTEKRLNDVPKSVGVDVTALRLGDVGIIGLACEPLCGIGRQIKRQTRLPVAVPCGYLDDSTSIGYVPDSPNNGDMDYQSSYYRYTTALLPYRDPAGDVLARASVRMLAQLARPT